jgi:sugar phosphate isomerase/epimerase
MATSISKDGGGGSESVKHILDRVSYHAVYDESILDALRYAKGNGFAGVQVAVETPHLSFESLTDAQCAEIASFCHGEGVGMSLHAPDDVASLFATSGALREGIFTYFERLLEFAARVSARLVTVHPGAMVRFRTDTRPPEVAPQSDRPAYAQALWENLERLAELSRGYSVPVCVEYWKTEPMLESALGPHLEAGSLALCWDVAKTFGANLVRNSLLEKYFRRNLSCVRQVHLHDIADGMQHVVLGRGCIDFMEFLPSLAEADVWDYCIEVRPREKALESLAHLTRIVTEASDGPASQRG